MAQEEKSGQHFEYCNSDSKSHCFLVATKVLISFVFCFVSLFAWILIHSLLIHSGIYMDNRVWCSFYFLSLYSSTGWGWRSKRRMLLPWKNHGQMFSWQWNIAVYDVCMCVRYKLHEEDSIFADVHLSTVHLLPWISHCPLVFLMSSSYWFTYYSILLQLPKSLARRAKPIEFYGGDPLNLRQACGIVLWNPYLQDEIF